jgi:choline monooxygenase
MLVIGVRDSSSLFVHRIFSRDLNTNLIRTKPCPSSTFYRLTDKDRAEIRDEVNKFNGKSKIESSSTPPSSWYSDPRFLTYEKETVFMKNWLYAGRKSLVKENNSYITGNILGEPYIIARDNKGKLSAYYNVCRHHGTTLLEQDHGKCNEIVCPYHGWTYSLDGKLKKATQIKNIVDFTAKDYGLVPLKLAEVGPFLFIHLGQDEPRFDIKEFDEAHQILSSRNYENLHWIKRIEYIVNSNWKIYVENYIDGAYHVPYLHPGLNSQIDVDKYQFLPKKNWSLQTVPGSSSQSDPYLKERVGNHGAVYAFLFPNIGVNRYGDFMDTNHVIPLTMDKTLVVFDWYYKEPLSPENKKIIDDNLKSGEEIQNEDEIICERVQKGVYSNGYDRGRYAPTVEIGTHHFHTWIHSNYSHVFNGSNKT